MNILESVLLTDDERDVIFSVAKRLFPSNSFFADEKDEAVVWVSEEEFKKLKKNAVEGLLTIYAAAAHFVNVSRVATDIAKAVNTTPDAILEIAKMRAWEEAVRSWGWTGNTMPEVYADPIIPLPLREAFLLKEVFQKYCPVRLITYDGFVDTHIKGVFKYELLLTDGRRLKKHNVILAFPEDRMSSVKNGIKRRKSVADLSLKPIVSRRDRQEIEVSARVGDTIECVMRNGLVVTGENIWISKYNIVIRVGGKKDMGGKVVLLYRHASHAFEVLQTHSEPQNASRDTFDDEADAP